MQSGQMILPQHATLRPRETGSGKDGDWEESDVRQVEQNSIVKEDGEDPGCCADSSVVLDRQLGGGRLGFWSVWWATTSLGCHASLK